MFQISAIDTEKFHKSAENCHPKLKNAVKGVVEVQYGKGVICFKKVQSMMKKVSYNTECAEKCRNMPSKVA